MAQKTPSDKVKKEKKICCTGPLQCIETLVDAMRDPALILNTELKIVFANSAFMKASGANKDIVAGQRIYEIKDISWDLSSLKEALKDFPEKKAIIIDFEIYPELSGKTNSHLLVSARQLYKERGRQSLIIVTIDDVTELKKTKEKLEIFKLAVENAAEHIVITDPEGRIIYANSMAERTTGYLFNEMQGKKPNGDLWGGQMERATYDKLWHIIKEEKQVYYGQIKNRHKSGYFYIADVRIAPVLNKENEVVFFVGIERDVTKEREEEQAKNEFVSMASHQLRTPLTGISLNAEMLLLGHAGNLSKDQKSYLKDIFHGVQSMTEVIETLLDVSRIKLGTIMTTPEPIQINSFLENLLKEFTSQIKNKHIELEKEYGENIPVMLIDKKIMRLVLENLLSNAIKYTGKGKKITITTQKDKNNVLIKVADEGCGIPNNQQSKIFTKSFRADNAIRSNVAGDGLGLYTTQMAVKQYGGKIWFKSKENKGTAFYVTVPLSGMNRTNLKPHFLFDNQPPAQSQ